MSTEHPISHATEGDSAFVDRLRAIPGAVRKAPAPAKPAAATPATGPTPADPFGRDASKVPAGFVEVPAPAGTRTAPGAPRVRHFRADGTAKMRTRVISGAILRPDPAA